MRVGVCVRQIDGPEMADSFRDIVEQGFSSCQPLSWHPEFWTDENAAIIREAVDKYGVTISAFWCGWEGPCVWNFYDGQETLGLVPVTFRHARMKNLTDGADFARKLGVTDVISHMGYIPENPYDPNFQGFCVAIRAVAKHLKENGQYLLFETGQETPVALLRCFEVVGLDNLGVNLDTANVILYGKANPVDALDVIGPYVRNLHVKDGFYPTDGHSLGRETKLGEGRVDFPRLIARLKEIGYDGELTIEREISGEQQIRDILESKVFLEQLIAENS